MEEVLEIIDIESGREFSEKYREITNGAVVSLKPSLLDLLRYLE